MKTKLGISTGLLGAAMYLTSLFSGYTVLTLLAGYVLLCEEDAWLKRTAVKAFAVCICFSTLSALVGFLPNLTSLFDAISNLFEDTFYNPFLAGVTNLLQIILTILEKVLLLLLALKALKNDTVKIAPVDKLLDAEFGVSAAPAPANSGEVKFCTSCGSKIPAATAFCPYCGKQS